MMTWDEIYEAAINKGFGDFELTRKDIARSEIIGFTEENFGFDLEDGSVECVEEAIEDYANRYNIWFDTDGHIKGHSKIVLEDKFYELLEHYGTFCNYSSMESALQLLKESLVENKWKKYLISMVATYVDKKYGAVGSDKRKMVLDDIASITGMTLDESIEIEKEAAYVIW